MKAVNPYLNFPGNTEEAFNFYKSVFGGEFSMLQRFKDMPEGGKQPEANGNLIMHISLPLKNGTVLMATDTPDSMNFNLITGNNLSLCISTESEAESDELFKKLSEGGKVDMPLEKTFWGAYFGMFTDKYGIQWMISFDYNK